MSLEVRRNVGPFEWITCPKLDRHDVLPPAALFGDSFADGMTRSGLFDYFEQLARVRRHQADLSDMLQALPRGTRYVIVQFIEVGLPEFLSIKLPRDNSPTAILPPAATQCAT